MLRARGCAVTTREALREKLRDVSGSFRVVDSLRTGLYAESDGGGCFDVTLGPPATTHAFLDASTGTVFVSPPDNPTARGSLASPLLARAVASALGVGDDGTATAALVALVQAAASTGEDPKAMEATTAAFGGNVRDDKSSSRDSDVPVDTAHGDDASAASARGDPGAVVLPRDARLLAARPLRPLVAGETCAIKSVRRFGSPGEAAAAAAESRASSSGGVATNEDRYVYARVVSATRPVKGAALTRVLLESGPGGETREALSSEVFTFRLVSELGPDETGAGAGGGSGRGGPEPTPTASRDPPQTDAVTPANPGVESASPDGGHRADSGLEDASLGTNPVSSDDLVRAVRDLLTAAGAPPSMAQADLLAANQRLRGELEDVSGAVQAAEKEIAEKEAHAIRVEKAFLCPITQGVMADPVVATDGHTYERRAIEQWFSQGRLTSPVTNLRLNTTTLVPNHALRGAITAHASRSGGGE